MSRSLLYSKLQSPAGEDEVTLGRTHVSITTLTGTRFNAGKYLKTWLQLVTARFLCPVLL